MADGVHLDLDGGWPTVPGIPTRELRDWGRRLRYIARPSDIETFFSDIARSLPPFVLYGSGDFHHLAGVFLRRVTEPLTLVSFDNHPDWDVRRPKWACGAWVSRALEQANVQEASVWGCGNFELSLPSRLFANRSPHLTIYAWAERQPESVQRRYPCMTRADWRERFTAFARALAGRNVYATIDMDCLRAEEAATNWENGLFTADDVAWAIGQLRTHSNLLAGDLCGAWSQPAYARRFQRFAGWWDHPKEHARPSADAHAVNAASLQTLWPALIGASQHSIV